MLSNQPPTPTLFPPARMVTLSEYIRNFTKGAIERLEKPSESRADYVKLALALSFVEKQEQRQGIFSLLNRKWQEIKTNAYTLSIQQICTAMEIALGFASPEEFNEIRGNMLSGLFSPQMQSPFKYVFMVLQKLIRFFDAKTMNEDLNFLKNQLGRNEEQSELNFLFIRYALSPVISQICAIGNNDTKSMILSMLEILFQASYSTGVVNGTKDIGIFPTRQYDQTKNEINKIINQMLQLNFASLGDLEPYKLPRRPALQEKESKTSLHDIQHASLLDQQKSLTYKITSRLSRQNDSSPFSPDTSDDQILDINNLKTMQRQLSYDDEEKFIEQVISDFRPDNSQRYDTQRAIILADLLSEHIHVSKRTALSESTQLPSHVVSLVMRY